MMFTDDYLLAWAIYGSAALGCLLVWFRLTRPLWRYLREPLRLMVAVLLLTPTLVDPQEELFAPALAIVALDLSFQVGSSVLLAVADLAMYEAIALALYLLLVAIRWPIEQRLRQRRAQSASASQPQDARTLSEIMDDERDEPLSAGPRS